MSKVSMAEAAKMFDVSRPTLAKHLKQGKISGEQVQRDKQKVWQLDVSELKRVYAYRDAAPEKVMHEDLSVPSGGAAPNLQAENRVLQAKLEAALQLAEERGQHIEDLRLMLPAPGPKARRKWWPFGE
jgi:hypothetical protein